MKGRIFGKTYQLLALGLLFTSCAGMFEYRPYARNVKKKPGKSGIIALKLEHRDEDRTLADSLMKRNCGSKKIEITDEGEVVVGSVTKSNTEKRDSTERVSGKFFGMDVISGNPASQSTQSETVSKKEWQLKYICK